MNYLEYMLIYFRFCYVIIMFAYHSILYRFKGRKNYSISNEENICGKVVVITGGSMGLGRASAEEFAKRGAIVVIGDVDLESGRKTVGEIQQQTGNPNIALYHLDLSDMESVEEFARKVKKQHPKIKILLNNAGLGGAHTTKKTKDGFNLYVSVNYLGHFLLTNLLLDNLKKETQARVVSMSSTLQLQSQLDIDDLMMDNSGFGPQNSFPYCNTKYCLSLFTKELGERLQNTGVKSYALCPGIVKTSIYKNVATLSAFIFGLLIWLFGTSTSQSASEFILYCALDKSIEKDTGKMYHFRKQFTAANKRLDGELAKKLWTKSAQLVKLDERLREFNSK